MLCGACGDTDSAAHLCRSFVEVYFVWADSELQALVYILSPTTAIIDYAIGVRKQSANGQFFTDAKKEMACNKQFRLHQAFLL